MKTKRILAFALVFVLLMSTFAYATPTKTKDYTAEADCLKRVGLFYGTGSGYELDRQPTRIEAGVMLVRVLGLETEAFNSNTYSHPFIDVPGWAENYAKMLYGKNLSKGVSDTKFGSNEYATAKMYATFILRALGYSEDAGDFTYDDSVSKLIELGILEDTYPAMAGQTFHRNDMVHMSYKALFAKIKGTETTLQDSIFDAKGMVSKLDPNDMDKIVLPEWVNARPILHALCSYDENSRAGNYYIISITARGPIRTSADLSKLTFINEETGQTLSIGGNYKNLGNSYYGSLNDTPENSYHISETSLLNNWVMVPYNQVDISFSESTWKQLVAMGVKDNKVKVKVAEGFVKGLEAGEDIVFIFQ